MQMIRYLDEQIRRVGMVRGIIHTFLQTLVYLVLGITEYGFSLPHQMCAIAQRASPITRAR